MNAKIKKQFRRDLYMTISRELLKHGEEKSLKGAVFFIDEMKKNLDKATPAPESQGLISQIKNSFYVEETKRRMDGETVKGWNVRIPIDRRGLVLYLEYGTGLTGKKFSHPQLDVMKLDRSFFAEGEKSTFVTWKYAINYGKTRPVKVKNRYTNRFFEIELPYYTKMDGEEGFVFRKRPDSYIDVDDKPFKNRLETKYSWVKGYKDAKGRVVKPYMRYHKDTKSYLSKSTYIFTRGLNSIHYIYDAKVAIKNKLRNGQL